MLFNKFKKYFHNIKYSMNNSIFKVYTDGACINNGYPNKNVLSVFIFLLIILFY